MDHVLRVLTVSESMLAVRSYSAQSRCLCHVIVFWQYRCPKSPHSMKPSLNSCHLIPLLAWSSACAHDVQKSEVYKVVSRAGEIYSSPTFFNSIFKSSSLANILQLNLHLRHLLISSLKLHKLYFTPKQSTCVPPSFCWAASSLASPLVLQHSLRSATTTRPHLPLVLLTREPVTRHWLNHWNWLLPLPSASHSWPLQISCSISRTHPMEQMPLRRAMVREISQAAVMNHVLTSSQEARLLRQIATRSRLWLELVWEWLWDSSVHAASTRKCLLSPPQRLIYLIHFKVPTHIPVPPRSTSLSRVVL